MSRKAVKSLAQEIYLHSNISQKEVAEKVGVSEQTVSKWVNQGNWRVLRTAKNVSRQSLLQKAYANLEKMNDLIDEHQGVPPKQLTDAKSVFVREVQALDKQDSLSHAVSIMEGFMAFMFRRDPKLAKEISQYQLEFIETRAHETQR